MVSPPSDTEEDLFQRWWKEKQDVAEFLKAERRLARLAADPKLLAREYHRFADPFTANFIEIEDEGLADFFEGHVWTPPEMFLLKLYLASLPWQRFEHVKDSMQLKAHDMMKCGMFPNGEPDKYEREDYGRDQWVKQGTWKPEWDKRGICPRERWMHQDMDDLQRGRNNINHEQAGPAIADTHTYKQAQMSRPIHQFLAEIADERDFLLMGDSHWTELNSDDPRRGLRPAHDAADATGATPAPPYGINTETYESVKSSWKEWCIWDDRLGVLPGMIRHSDLPFSEFERQKKAEEAAKAAEAAKRAKLTWPSRKMKKKRRISHPARKPTLCNWTNTEISQMLRRLRCLLLHPVAVVPLPSKPPKPSASTFNIFTPDWLVTSFSAASQAFLAKPRGKGPPKLLGPAPNIAVTDWFYAHSKASDQEQEEEEEQQRGTGQLAAAPTLTSATSSTAGWTAKPLAVRKSARLASRKYRSVYSGYKTNGQTYSTKSPPSISSANSNGAPKAKPHKQGVQEGERACKKRLNGFPDWLFTVLWPHSFSLRDFPRFPRLPISSPSSVRQKRSLFVM